MNEKTTIRFVLTGVKYSQSDLGKHYKTFCGLYLFGFMGVIFGPLLLSLFFLFVNMFKKGYLDGAK